ncbi:MAG: type II secretion system F family protein, partial [Solirubrobacteraceae bacterium]
AALRAGSLLAFTLAGVAAWMVVGGVMGAGGAAGLAGFGWAYPDLWLRSAAARRCELIERRAPLLLDMLAATVAAGVGIDRALEAATHAVDGPLRDELELTLANLALGRRRGAELRDLAERSGSPSLAHLGAALRMSDRLGVPVADVLRRQADRARADRARDVQERAARAGPRMLMVVVFVLVPASLLPLLAAVALTALGSLGEMGF